MWARFLACDTRQGAAAGDKAAEGEHPSALSASRRQPSLVRATLADMKLLVLGGTRFVGRAVVSAAVDRGFDVTVVTRGDSGEPPAAGDLAPRRPPRRRRDATVGRAASGTPSIDTWADDPQAVAISASLLSQCAGLVRLRVQPVGLLLAAAARQ